MQRCVLKSQSLPGIGSGEACQDIRKSFLKSISRKRKAEEICPQCSIKRGPQWQRTQKKVLSAFLASVFTNKTNLQESQAMEARVECLEQVKTTLDGRGSDQMILKQTGHT